MNYKLLLEKYIKHVLSNEGVTFLDGTNLELNNVGFTKEELIKLDEYFVSFDYNYLFSSQRINIEKFYALKNKFDKKTK